MRNPKKREETSPRAYALRKLDRRLAVAYGISVMALLFFAIVFVMMLLSVNESASLPTEQQSINITSWILIAGAFAWMSYTMSTRRSIIKRCYEDVRMIPDEAIPFGSSAHKILQDFVAASYDPVAQAKHLADLHREINSQPSPGSADED